MKIDATATQIRIASERPPVFVDGKWHFGTPEDAIKALRDQIRSLSDRLVDIGNSEDLDEARVAASVASRDARRFLQRLGLGDSSV